MFPTVTLRAFFRPLEDELTEKLGPAAYAAGFEDQDGEQWGVMVPLGQEDVELTVLANAQFSVSMQLDGSLLIDADGLSDAANDQISKKGSLAQAAIDELVREALQPKLLTMEDDPQARIRELRHRLKETLALVEKVLQNLG